MNHHDHMVSMLLKSENYREFLLQSFNYMKDRKPGFSLTTLARKIGCKSKSYPREVMIGRRSLTFDYAPGFVSALGLKGDAKKLFLKFVELERSPQKDLLNTEIQEIKNRLKNRVEHPTQKPQDFFYESTWIDIYAALGTIERGASLEEIQLRTGLKSQSLLATLKAMQDKDLIQYRANLNRFYPQTLHHFFSNVDQDAVFQKRFLDLVGKLNAAAKVAVKSETNLFQCSTISVFKKDMPKLKQELRELIQRFAQDAESPDGDRLAHLVVGFIS